MSEIIVKDATSWDSYFIKMATLVASKSKDPSTKVGAVIVGAGNEVLTTGFNGFPRGVDEVNNPDRWERPDKYDWIVHAEANCVANAARSGIALLNSTLYLNFAPSPCSKCAGLLVQAGIRTIIGPNISFTGAGKGVHYDIDNITQTMMVEVDMTRYVVNEEEE